MVVGDPDDRSGDGEITNRAIEIEFGRGPLVSRFPLPCQQIHGLDKEFLQIPLKVLKSFDEIEEWRMQLELTCHVEQLKLTLARRIFIMG